MAIETAAESATRPETAPTASAVAAAPEIVLRKVTLEFPQPGGGRLTVFRDLDLEVERGSFTILLGPSGCGKSTLLHVIDGLVTPTRAEKVEVLGRDVRHDKDVTRNIAYVFQNARLLPWRTLRQNAEFGLRGLGTQPRKHWPQLMEHYFGVVGLTDFVNYYPHQVSGGMQQRASIVRAFVNEPRILLMDEPFSHLDELTAADLRTELVRLWSQDEDRRTVVFVTHDISEAVTLGERIVMMTSRPSTICFTASVDLPWPREPTNDGVFELEKRLRTVFAERSAGRA
jgi:ABC-type nitrate/sulfonate/bicarbonate transport system ATPase subunit